MFNHRNAVMLACAVVTVLLASLAATRLAERQLREDDPAQPSLHPELPGQPVELRGLGNALRIVVENPKGDIYDPSTEHAAARSTTSSS